MIDWPKLKRPKGHASRVMLGSAFALMLAIASREARAESSAISEPRAPSIEWEAPEGCPDAQSIWDRLRDELSHAPAGAGAGFRVRGRIAPGGQKSWILSLAVTPPNDTATGTT